MNSHLQTILLRSINKPLKVDLRSVCEHNIAGPVTQTFSLRRKDLVSLLKNSNEDIVDRIDVTEYNDESRLTVYNVSRMDNPAVPKIKTISEGVTHWDLDPQYGEWSARWYKEEPR